MIRFYAIVLSETRNNIIARLDESAGTVIEHLIKFYCYPNEDESVQLRDEIYNAIHKVSQLKLSNKFPKAEMIFDSMWTLGNYKTFSIQYANVIYDYGEPSVTEEDTKEFVINYLKWLSERLSEYGIIFKGDVNRYLLGELEYL